MQKNNDIIVENSKIHGKGVFAARDFKKGKIVIKWRNPKTISKKNLEKLSKKKQQNISYINTRFYLVPLEGRVNHSCNPNVYLKDFCYFAKRKIKKGEEITANYLLESEPEFKMKCNCKSKNCKKIITNK